MSLQHTPPNKFLSEPDISKSGEGDVQINICKRKQPEDEYSIVQCLSNFEARFNNQMQLWNTMITEKVTSCVATAVSAAITIELSKITPTLAEINVKLTKLTSDNISLNKTLAETNNKLVEIEKSLDFSSERQDAYENRLKSIENSVTSNCNLENQICILEYKISQMEQQARQCNIEIFNLQERRAVTKVLYVYWNVLATL
ncbi:unnamed protein product [Chilo suppressalis]|uniref:Uncharacterized protein n=1 Tax=Chilo suppressalis TaxID=168631 RepID=A0ABN8AYX0_CHISP|nr:unnamed protein product [Chilo suppressalis]